MGKRTCSLSWCDEPHEAHGFCPAHHARWKRGVDLTKPIRRRRSGPAVARFWAEVDRSGDCWVWTGPTDKDGYGRCAAVIEGVRCTRAPRFSWWLATGENPGKLWVLHHCDNPPCVRPEHLFVGSAADNNADMIAKGREYYPTGDDHYARLDPARIKCGDDSPFTRTSDAAVAEIRQRWASGGVTQASLAIEYGISPTHVCNICKGKSRVIPGRRNAA